MHKIFRPLVQVSKSVSRSLRPPNLILFFVHDFSQSTSIPKKQQRVRDHGYDNYMEIEKKIRKVLKVQELILSQPNSMLSSARLDNLSRRLGFKQFEAGRFVLKFPHIFDVFEHPVQRILYCRLTRKALIQIQQENEAVMAQIDGSVTRLRKLLMLSNTKRLGLEHVRITKREFGFPEDFEYSVILKHPEFFRLFEDKESKSKYIELVEKDPELGVCAIEKVRETEYREKGGDAENIRFSFIINFPPGFKTGKYYKIAIWKWQRLPYWSPYENVSGYDMRSLEAQKRMEKRAVAMIHEILSLTVEKKISLERIAHFRITMNLPKKLKDFLLQHQGIFYISTRGNYGKLHTIFLREAYNKGELIESNDVYLARRQLAKLITLRRPNTDHQFVYHRRESASDCFDRVDLDQVKIGSEKSWNEVKIGDNEQGIDGSEPDLESDGECCGVDEEDEENKLID
ncbi:putative plant organelle RNA recognition domain, protein root primordium defective 1 [Helianthus annuus]|nr:putative plant organelle RNA recognition domain, protein root primordium defective 1 [Helianthus annuus]KAJ0892883.1 putative plant organelle RNA recognition domain, protein root primordium defective 1 [Helianthus annuus]